MGDGVTGFDKGSIWLDSAAVSIFVDKVVELTNKVFLNSNDITTNI